METLTPAFCWSCPIIFNLKFINWIIIIFGLHRLIKKLLELKTFLQDVVNPNGFTNRKTVEWSCRTGNPFCCTIYNNIRTTTKKSENRRLVSARIEESDVVLLKQGGLIHFLNEEKRNSLLDNGTLLGLSYVDLKHWLL